MHKFLLDIPTSFETERLLLRAYQPGDGPWYLAMAQRNLTHLARYETDNPARSLVTEDDAENLVRQLAATWKGALGFVFGPLGAHRVRLECDDTNLRSELTSTP